MSNNTQPIVRTNMNVKGRNTSEIVLGQREKILELMSEAATASLLKLYADHLTISLSNEGFGHVGEFEWADCQEALRFILAWGRDNRIRVAGKDKNGRLLYFLMCFNYETYGFVGNLDEVEACIDGRSYGVMGA